MPPAVWKGDRPCTVLERGAEGDPAWTGDRVRQPAGSGGQMSGALCRGCVRSESCRLSCFAAAAAGCWWPCTPRARQAAWAGSAGARSGVCVPPGSESTSCPAV